MNEAVLQVLLILAFLAIGLISVTFPIYAISVNFLPQQKWESEKERGTRKAAIQAKIAQLTTELGKPNTETKQLDQITKELDNYRTELKGTNLRCRYLTANGAVLTPVLILIGAMLFTVVGIYGFYKSLLVVAIGMGIGSSIFLLWAILRLYKTISAIEYAALRPERTVEFKVGFGYDYEKTVKLEVAKVTPLRLVAKSNDFDVENLLIMAEFPSDLQVASGVGDPDLVITQQKESTIIALSEVFLPKGIGEGFTGHLTPTKTGKYAIAVRVCGKGIYEYREKLYIDVV